MEETNTEKYAIPVILFLVLLVFLVFVMGYAFDKNEKVRCLKLQSQAVEFSESYSKWAKEFPETHKRDVTGCKQYGVEIVLK